MIRVFEAFAGYGSQAMALKRLKDNFPTFDYEVVGISEIDKYALKAYEAVHGHCPNYGDISKIDWHNVPDFDLFTYSFPCTDISNAGAMKGLSEDSGTRSSLLWECRRAIEVKRPKYLIMENVKNLVSKKFLPDLQRWLDELDAYGYTSHMQVLDAADYGVPQSRKRVFVVSILNDSEGYMFPQPQPLKRQMADLLEDEVEAKFYLTPEQIKHFGNHNWRDLSIAAMRGRESDKPGVKNEQRLEINKRGIANTLTSVQKDNLLITRVHGGEQNDLS